MDATARHKLLSFMDAYFGYNQIGMCPEDEEKTTFTMDRGLYCYKVMLFGLKNAGATYKRLVTKVFTNLIKNDILVKSLHKEDHVTNLQETFALLWKHDMKLNPAKCAFGVVLGKFLGSWSIIEE